MKKVIFILSVGHSGSTLLDISLGQFKNTFSTGELKHLTWQYYRKIENIDSVQKCTCGEYFDNCIVWSNVINDLAKYRKVEIKKTPELVPIKHFDSLSYFTDFKKDKIIRYIYKWNLFYKIIPQKLFSNYLKKSNANNKVIYDSIFSHNPMIEYIIDSSKDIIRFNELRKKIDVFPVILIRDINEVMKSKWVKESKGKVIGWQNYYNKHILSIIKHMNDKDFHIISYERFIDNSLKSIEELSTKLNIDAAEFRTDIPMNDYHIVAGNGMRYTDVVNIKKREININDLKISLSNSGLDTFFIDRI
ncbi:MAG: hypothetical protein U5R06_03840 [candidate division KSB1 bacterium]|nr:hypothetical protein [candidate division KSB1 bacterium]